MTTMLETAFAEASRLSAQEQDALAAWLLDELRSERHWQHAFAQSQDLLSDWADEALREHRAGQNLPLAPQQV